MKKEYIYIGVLYSKFSWLIWFFFDKYIYLNIWTGLGRLQENRKWVTCNTWGKGWKLNKFTIFSEAERIFCSNSDDIFRVRFKIFQNRALGCCLRKKIMMKEEVMDYKGV